MPVIFVIGTSEFPILGIQIASHWPWPFEVWFVLYVEHDFVDWSLGK